MSNIHLREEVLLNCMLFLLIVVSMKIYNIFPNLLIDWNAGKSKKHKFIKRFLTSDSYIAFGHTLKALVQKYFLITARSQICVHSNVTGKFQINHIKIRFGQYRQIFGGNLFVIVQEIMESEKN